jgi:hypothetical protein
MHVPNAESSFDILMCKKWSLVYTEHTRYAFSEYRGIMKISPVFTHYNKTDKSSQKNNDSITKFTEGRFYTMLQKRLEEIFCKISQLSQKMLTNLHTDFSCHITSV